MTYTNQELDLDDQFIWDEIISTYDDDDTLLFRDTIFDDGTELGETFENGIRVSYTTQQSDLDDHYSWIHKHITFDDATGAILYRHTLFDNYTQKGETFENGVRVNTVQIDPLPEGGAAAWDLIETNYSEFGIIEDRHTEYDNGVVKDEVFEFGILSQSLQIDRSLRGFEKNWQSIGTTYTPQGTIDYRLTAYDNQTIKEETFENGIRTQTLQLDQSDDGDAKNWASIESHFNQFGLIESRVTEYDNQTMKDETFENGIRTQTIQLDLSDGGDAKNWASIESHFNQFGMIEGRVTEYDNQTIKDEAFENGIRSQTIQLDLSEGGHAKNWASIESYYDEFGIIEGRVTEYDNQTIKDETFENGIRTQTIQLDLSDGGDAKNWASIESHYNASGLIENRFTDYDNQTTKNETFEYTFDGVVKTVYQFDNSEGGNAVNWEEKETVYFANGTLDSREIRYDNGLLLKETFDHGVLSHSVKYDLSRGDVAYSWYLVVSDYDEFGRIENRETSYDNDTFISESFENGVRTHTQQTDTSPYGEAANWDMINTYYDENGLTESKTVFYDSSDVAIVLFSDGQKDSRLTIDNDDSSVWAAKETVFDPEGDVLDIVYYDDLADVPSVYDDYFV